MGRIVEGMKATIKNAFSKEVEGKTKGEIFEKLNLQYEEIELTIGVLDSAGEAIATPIVVLKTGAVAGSGDAVSAESGGEYKVKYGSYNAAVSKTGYNPAAAVITLGYDEAREGEAAVSVTLYGPAVVTISVKDAEGQAVDSPTIVLKKGAVVGSGDEVTAEQDGTYKVFIGAYNYSVAKDLYTTKTGTFSITAAQLEKAVAQAVELALAG